MYADSLRRMFPDLAPVVDDLFLLEPHQISNLPHRAPKRALGAVLSDRQDLVRFLVTRHPPIELFITEVMAEPKPNGDLAAAADELMWEIADLVVYQRAPEMYDRAVSSDWDREALAEAEPLADKVAVDVGAGTGQVALKVASMVRTVFAVEPVGTLRSYIRGRADDESRDNLFVLDGTLSEIPLPDDSIDVLLTQRAIGWDLKAEAVEISRVVRSGGVAIHLLGDAYPAAGGAAHHAELTGLGYRQASYEDGVAVCRKYVRHF